MYKCHKCGLLYLLHNFKMVALLYLVVIPDIRQNSFFKQCVFWASVTKSHKYNHSHMLFHLKNTLDKGFEGDIYFLWNMCNFSDMSNISITTHHTSFTAYAFQATHTMGKKKFTDCYEWTKCTWHDKPRYNTYSLQ